MEIEPTFLLLTKTTSRRHFLWFFKSYFKERIAQLTLAMTKTTPFGWISTGLTLKVLAALSPVARISNDWVPLKLGVAWTKLSISTGVRPFGPPNVTVLRLLLGSRRSSNVIEVGSVTPGWRLKISTVFDPD